jgi:hypothetical protein
LLQYLGTRELERILNHQPMHRIKTAGRSNSRPGPVLFDHPNQGGDAMEIVLPQTFIAHGFSGPTVLDARGRNLLVSGSSTIVTQQKTPN